MSVNYSTNIGFGYMLTQKEFGYMKSAAEQNGVWGQVEDEFYCIDAYSDNSFIFLGEIFSTIDSGDYAAMDLAIYPPTFDPEMFSRKYEEILMLCGIVIKPETKWETPKLYMMSMVS